MLGITPLSWFLLRLLDFLINFTDGFEVYLVITVVSVSMLVYYRTSVGKWYENTAKL